MATTNFTIANLKKLGAVHVPELDFGDDGTKFKMFEYKGVPVSYAKSEDDHYISIRFDYVDGLSYETYKQFPSYKNADEFNGVDTIDEAKLKENLEAAVEDLNTWATQQ